MDHNRFRRYVEDVWREFPSIPMAEIAKFYSFEPRTRIKHLAFTEVQLVDHVGIITKLGEDRLAAREIKIKFRALLAVLSSDLGIEPKEVLSALQSKGVVT